MPEIEVLMDDVPSEFEALDDTLAYRVRISEEPSIEYVKEGRKLAGEPMIAVTLEVTQPAEWTGKLMFERLMLPGTVTNSDTTGERRRKLERGIRLRKFMDAFSLSWQGGKINTKDWVATEAICTIKNEEYEGRTISRPKEYVKAT